MSSAVLGPAGKQVKMGWVSYLKLSFNSREKMKIHYIYHAWQTKWGSMGQQHCVTSVYWKWEPLGSTPALVSQKLQFTKHPGNFVCKQKFKKYL